MPFNIIQNDITKMHTDAIVNAANTNLHAGGGVRGAIFTEAGIEKLQSACNKIGYCATGNAVITKGYNLPAKYIIHTVGPVYGRDPEHEEKQLYSCYEQSLKLAKSKRIKSIAFPLISSGIYGYPKSEALRIAVSAIKNFLAKNEMNIYLVVYDRKAFAISEKLYRSIRNYIEDSFFLWDVTTRSIQEKDVHLQNICYAPNTTMDSPNRLLKDIMNRDVETFSQMLLRLIDEKDMTDVEVYKRANIDRKLFSKIRKKNYTPRKHTVIALAIALKLNLDEAIDLLKRAGFAFSECDKFDIIIEYFIEHKKYDIFEINETLFYFEQPLLGV